LLPSGVTASALGVSLNSVTMVRGAPASRPGEDDIAGLVAD